MTRMLVIITAALAILWVPSQAAWPRTSATASLAGRQVQSHELLKRDRFSGIALR